ncbi:hypothetical protein ES707_17469 [subsurface metagenome]
MSSEVKKIYTLMAIFSLYNPEQLSTRELCEVVEEATGEPFSTEALEEMIDKISREVSLEDKIDMAKIIQKFLSTFKLLKEKQKNS